MNVQNSVILVRLSHVTSLSSSALPYVGNCKERSEAFRSIRKCVQESKREILGTHVRMAYCNSVHNVFFVAKSTIAPKEIHCCARDNCYDALARTSGTFVLGSHNAHFQSPIW